MIRDRFYFMLEGGPMGGEDEAYPLVDLLVTPQEVCLLAEVPGIPRQALDLKIEEDCVEIRGRRSEPEFFAKAIHFYKLESFYGFFERRITLPVEVEPRDAKVNLSDGVLRIRIPRRRPKVIEIPVK